MKPPGKPNIVRDDELEVLICDCLDLLLPTLTAKQAEVVRAIDLEGASAASVADRLDLSLNEVTTCLAQGRQGLKDRFGEMHMVCLQHGLADCDCLLRGDPET